MRHSRILGGEGLELRRLMTRAHPVHAEVVAPIALDGTLAVNQKGATATQDAVGDTVVATPVVGTLGGVGLVRGTWTQTADALGDPLGANTLVLRNAQGSFTVTFAPGNHGKAHATGPGGASYRPLVQKVTGGSRAYAHAAESGLLVVNTNATGKVVESITLTSNPM